MEVWNEIYQIINSNVLDISERVAGISLTQAQPIDIMHPYTLHLSAVGTYQLDLYLYTDETTLRRIASNMKKSEAAKDEIPSYATEFFNILGGRIVSKINRLFRQSARFKPPVFLNHEVLGDGSERTLTLFYRYLEGNVKIEGQFVNSDAL